MATSRRNESLPDLLIKAPWWISVILAVLSYAGIRWGLPLPAGNDPLLSGFARGFSQFAPLVGMFFLFLAGVSAFHSYRNGKLVDRQRSLDTLKELTWKEFEWMVAEAYKRRGYSVEESLGGGPDGGVDLVLHKSGITTLVQCKRWKTRSVGVPIVRELFGIMTDQEADMGIVVCCGHFTEEAKKFAQRKPIELIDGEGLLQLVQGVQQQKRLKPEKDQESLSKEPPACPKCGAPMVLRTARKGPRKGQQFYGCSSFPKCRETRSSQTAVCTARDTLL